MLLLLLLLRLILKPIRHYRSAFSNRSSSRVEVQRTPPTTTNRSCHSSVVVSGFTSACCVLFQDTNWCSTKNTLPQPPGFVLTDFFAMEATRRWSYNRERQRVLAGGKIIFFLIICSPLTGCRESILQALLWRRKSSGDCHGSDSFAEPNPMAEIDQDVGDFLCDLRHLWMVLDGATFWSIPVSKKEWLLFLQILPSIVNKSSSHWRFDSDNGSGHGS